MKRFCICIDMQGDEPVLECAIDEIIGQIPFMDLVDADCRITEREPYNYV